MRKNETGFGLVMVLILLALGSLLIAPVLRLTYTTLKAKQINTAILDDQYARDGAAEFGIWQLLYGGATTFLNDTNECPDNECTYEVVLNGITSQVTLRMRTELGTSEIAGAEGNALRALLKVECAPDNDGVFYDDCSNLPVQDNMVARYTVTLRQVSPDVSAGLIAVWNELPPQFEFVPGFHTVDSPDGSFDQIVAVTPFNEGTTQNQVWRWTFDPPLTFVKDEEKVFRFEADIRGNTGRYCNGVFLDMESPAPTEKSDKTTGQVLVGVPSDTCQGGGLLATLYVDQQVAPPNTTTIFTYIANIGVLENNTLQLSRIKNVLPQGGFVWCDPVNPPVTDPPSTCDAPRYKIMNDSFLPPPNGPGSFTDLTGYTVLPDPTMQYLDPDAVPDSGDERWELVWDDGWTVPSGDNLIVRFQAHVTPTESGSYYNELFADVDTGCSAGNLSDIITNPDYCATYSWPTGGTLVPMYDVNSEADLTSGQGNVIVGGSGTTLESWHVDDL